MQPALYVLTTYKKTNVKLRRRILDNVKVAIAMQKSVFPALLYLQCSM
jgi:hypothetical protein